MFCMLTILLVIDSFSLTESFRFDLGDWELQNPTKVTTDEKGNIFLLDTGASHVYIFDKEGNPVTFFGKKGQGPGEFNFIGNINIVYKNKQIFISDDYTSSVQVFDDTFKFVEKKQGTFRISQMVSSSTGFVLSSSNSLKRKQSAIFVGSDFVEKQSLLDIDFLRWQINEKRSWTLHYYSNLIRICGFREDLILAESNSATLNVWRQSKEFKKMKTLNVPLVANGITKRDREQCISRAKARRFDFVIPDETWVIYDLINYRDQYLLVTQDIVQEKAFVKSIVIDSNYNILGHLKYFADDVKLAAGLRSGLLLVKEVNDEYIPIVYSINASKK